MARSHPSGGNKGAARLSSLESKCVIFTSPNMGEHSEEIQVCRQGCTNMLPYEGPASMSVALRYLFLRWKGLWSLPPTPSVTGSLTALPFSLSGALVPMTTWFWQLRPMHPSWGPVFLQGFPTASQGLYEHRRAQVYSYGSCHHPCFCLLLT